MKKIILIFLLQLSALAFAQQGYLDTTFNAGMSLTDTEGQIMDMAFQPDGKIIIGGGFKVNGATSNSMLARLNADGSLDKSFNNGTGKYDYEQVQAISVLPDGKIIVGGYFTAYNGTVTQSIARLNPDGSVDTTFNSGTGVGGEVYNTAVQTDGKIIIVGNFWSYNGVYRNNIARLNKDGSLDMSFNQGTGTDGIETVALAIQSDGKIIIGGLFSTYNGTAVKNIARLNPDGTLDTSFNTGTGTDGDVWTASVQPDGKIIIGGWFKNYNGIPAYCIARLNADGSLETGFNLDPSGYGAIDGIINILIQSDGKIIITGEFTSYDGIPRNSLARLNQDGTLDTTFHSGLPFGYLLFTALIQPDDKVIIAGDFATYDGIDRNHIARLNTDVLPPVANPQSFCSVTTISDLAATGTNLKWYTASTGGTALPPSYVVKTGTYYVSQTVAGFESHRTAVFIKVNDSGEPEFIIEKTIINDFSDNNKVTVIISGPGEPEFSLDNPTGPFQDSDTFENVQPGIHTIYVKNKNGCGHISKTINVVGAPPFFTPNGDSYNDTWKLQGISASYLRNTRVDIMDRFGKLLKVIPNAESEGWDGTYNGYNMPSNDYWFVAHLEDGREGRGHFTLKR